MNRERWALRRGFFDVPATLTVRIVAQPGDLGDGRVAEQKGPGIGAGMKRVALLGALAHTGTAFVKRRRGTDSGRCLEMVKGASEVDMLLVGVLMQSEMAYHRNRASCGRWPHSLPQAARTEYWKREAGQDRVKPRAVSC